MRLLATLLLSSTLLASALTAQEAEVPSLRWQTIRTEHFRIHYEPELAEWARKLAGQIEGVRTAVAARVGYTPPRVIDIIVEDPLNVPNGSAWPLLTYPAMRFWATPPAPTSGLSNLRGWGEVLAVHEYAHLAHLLRPSRAPLAFPLAVLGVLPLGPIVGSPAWVVEGYATLIEGELTGAGRPNSALRAGVLRTLALEGELPAYAALDNTNRFNGGAMRYLVGSAYLEWLQAARGDSALPQLWRRMTSRSDREFPDAFTGTFGEPPQVLYGRFSAEVTQRAFAAKTELDAVPNARGELTQRWGQASGAPDISPNGERLVIRRVTPNGPGGPMLYSLLPDTAGVRRDSTRLAKLLKKDPEDVAPYQPFPRAYPRLAVLGPVGGVPYDAPRFFADGDRVLVTRPVRLRDGRARSDLFVWNTENGKVRRVTRGAGIQLADPTPDGREAVALQCGAGTCSVVVVDLSSGAQHVLAVGGIDRGYSGVRVSPDGRYVATARQDGARWDVYVIELATGSARRVGPQDGAARYAATWESDSALIVVSDASGVQGLERLSLTGGAATAVAQTLGAAMHPEVGPDGRIWWLDLHARGWDLRSSEAGTALPATAPLDGINFPATRRVNAALAQDFVVAPVAAPQAYGAGPWGAILVATGTNFADGETWSLGGSFGDPLGRGTVLAHAGVGRFGAWSGARAAYTWRGWRPELQLQGFTTDYRPSQHAFRTGPLVDVLDATYDGGSASVTLRRSGRYGRTTYRVGGSAGSVRNPTLATDAVERQLGFASLAGDYTFTPRLGRRAQLRYQLDVSTGRTDGREWQRRVADITVGMSVPAGGANLRLRGGDVSKEAQYFEQFAIGGTASPYVDAAVLAQRVEHPGLAFAIAGGTRYGIATLETAGPLRAYHDWIAAGTDGVYGQTLRVLGLEYAMAIPRITVMRVPPGHLRAGVSHTLNGQSRNVTIGYLGLSIAP
ncbi:MAG: hypothetical protein KF689_08015 [Gemmatimonadaceae bacterium]|nr:hypothetical protein [Gemmatimonadaceae bacterium]